MKCFNLLSFLSFDGGWLVMFFLILQNICYQTYMEFELEDKFSQSSLLCFFLSLLVNLYHHTAKKIR